MFWTIGRLAKRFANSRNRAKKGIKKENSSYSLGRIRAPLASVQNGQMAKLQSWEEGDAPEERTLI